MILKPTTTEATIIYAFRSYINYLMTRSLAEEALSTEVATIGVPKRIFTYDEAEGLASIQVRTAAQFAELSQRFAALIVDCVEATDDNDEQAETTIPSMTYFWRVNSRKWRASEWSPIT